jgi:surface-adhesin protein E
LKTAVKLLSLFFYLSIVFLSYQAEASTPAEASSPATKKALKENWKYYTSDEDGAGFYYNPETVQHGLENHVKVWVRAIYPEKNLKYTNAEFQWEIDCTKKSLRGLSASARKKDGVIETTTEPSNWSPIPSESTAETLYETVCKKKERTTP